MLLGEIDQCAAQCNKLPNQCIDRTAQPQSQIGRDLIVARACRVQSLSCITGECDQTPLDIEVNVLELPRKLKLAALDFGADLRETGFDRAQIVGGNDIRVGQHPRVRE